MARRRTQGQPKKEVKAKERIYGPDYSKKVKEWKEMVQRAHAEYGSDLEKIQAESGVKVKERKLSESFELKKGVQKIAHSKKGRRPALVVEVDEKTAEEWLEKYPRMVSKMSPGTKEGTVVLRLDVVKRSKTGYVEDVLKKVEESSVIRELGKAGKGPEVVRVMVTKEQLNILQDKYPSLKANVIGDYSGVLIADIHTRSSQGMRNEAFADIILDAIAEGEMIPLAKATVKKTEKKRTLEEKPEKEAEAVGAEPGGGGQGASEKSKAKKSSTKVVIEKSVSASGNIIPPELWKLLLILIIIAVAYGIVRSILGW